MSELDQVNTTIDTPQSIEQDMQGYKETFESKKDQEISSEFDSIADNLGLTQKSADASLPDPNDSDAPPPNIDESQQDSLTKDQVDAPKKEPIEKPQETLDDIVAKTPEGKFVAPIDQTLDTVKPLRLPLGADVVLGVLQAPTSVLSGLVKSSNELLNVIDKGGTFLNELMGLPQTDKKFSIPDVNAKFPTVTGDIIETTAQFLSGFGFVGKMLKGFGVTKAATKAGKAVEIVSKGAAADVISFDQQQERLSNLIQSVPSLENPITEYLAADKDDSFLEGKIKQAAEGAFIGAGMEVAVAGIVSGVKLLKHFKKPASKTVVTAEEIAAKQQEELKKGFETLGDIEDERLVYNVTKSVNDVDGLSAKQIKKLAKKGEIPQREESEFVINLSRVETPEDIQAVMRAFVENNKLRNKEATRGVRTFDITKRAAEDINGFQTLMDRRVGQAFNAEEVVAAQQWYYYITDKLVEASNKVAIKTVSSADVFAFRKIMSIHDATQTAISGARAESGRSVGAWRIPADGSGINVKAINEVLNQYGGKENIIELAQKIASLGKDMTAGQINNITKKGAYAANRDAFIEVWTLGLLTSPPTHVRNILSSGIVAVAEIPKKAIQSFIPESGVHLGSIPYYSLGAVRSLNEAFVNSAKAFRGEPLGDVFGRGISGGKLTELPRERASAIPRELLEERKISAALSESPSELFSQKEYLKATATFLKGFKDNLFITPYAYGMDYYGRAMGVAGKALSGGDAFVRTVLFRAESNSILANKGISQGLKGKELDKFITNGTNDLDTKTIDLAKSFAETNIFINDLGKTGKLGQKILSALPMLKFAVPFYRTPANLLKWQYHNSPLALLSRDVREKIAGGGAERGEVLAKMGMGTIVMQLASDQSLRGNITGALSTNIGLRKHQEAMGMKPYSIKFGDTWYGYGSLDPIGGIIGFSADLTTILANYESYDMEEQDSVEELVTAGTLLFANQVIGKGFLGGVTDLFDALSDPNKPKRFFDNVVAGFIPQGLATVARGLDSESKMVGDLADKLKAKIPYFSKDVPRGRNIWGETISPSVPTSLGMMGEAGKFLNMAINPFYVSNEIDRPASKWMFENGLPLSMPSKTLTYEGTKINLKELPEHTEIYSRFVELRGQDITLDIYDGLNMQDYMDNLLSDNTDNDFFFNVFQTLDEQKAYLDKVVKNYTDAAKKQLREEFPAIIDYEITMAGEKEKRMAADPIIQKIMNGG